MYTISQIKNVIIRDETSISTNLISQSLHENTEIHNISEGGFVIGIGGQHVEGDHKNIFF